MSLAKKKDDILECLEKEQEDRLNKLIDSCEDFILVDEQRIKRQLFKIFFQMMERSVLDVVKIILKDYK